MPKCKNCKQPFEKKRQNQIVCSPSCAYEFAKTKAKKEKNKELKERKERLKTRSQHLNELQVIFNAYIRERDKNQPCISCGKPNGGNEQAGHYRSVGSCPELRFEENNVFGQCIRCNMYEHGNLIEYRKGLIERVGLHVVEWLELNHDPKKYTIEQIKELKEHYKNETKLIRQSRQGTI